MGITTDIIVDQPGEIENEFEEMVSLLNIVKFNMACIFNYSPRTGTKLTELVDDARNDEKERRNQILLKRIEEISLHDNQQLLGQTVEILIESHVRRGANMMLGWTPKHYKVLFEATEDNIGKIVPVKIDGFTTTVLSGLILSHYFPQYIQFSRYPKY
jgi:tRNA-2-methylthio-N6-dimethylallyladenosine synthase